jgi:hypothetical protein
MTLQKRKSINNNSGNVFEMFYDALPAAERNWIFIGRTGDNSGTVAVMKNHVLACNARELFQFSTEAVYRNFTTLAAPVSVLDATITLTDSSSLHPIAGQIKIGPHVYTFTANNTGTGVLTLSTPSLYSEVNGAAVSYAYSAEISMYTASYTAGWNTGGTRLLLGPIDSLTTADFNPTTGAGGAALLLGIQKPIGFDVSMWIDKSGGHFYNNFTPYDDNTYTLGDSTHRFSEIWATKIIEGALYTVGESITTGDVVCLKPTTTNWGETAADSDATYISETNPTTNYDGETQIQCGYDNHVPVGQELRGYVNFDLSSLPLPEHILKAELILTIYQKIGTVSEAYLRRVSGASWAEDTLTWNNKPAHTDDVYSAHDSVSTKTLGALDSEVTFDVTQIIRKMKDTYLVSYGFAIQSDGNSASQNYVAFYSNHASVTASKRPRLRIVSTAVSDGYIYKADADDYTLCRNIVGFAQSTVASGSCGVKPYGNITNISFGSGNIGTKVYLSSTAGGYDLTTTSAARVIGLGVVTASSGALVDIQRQDIFIEKSAATMGTGGQDFPERIYAPIDARYIELEFHVNTVTGASEAVLRVNRESAADNSLNINYTDGTGYLSAAWSGNYVTISNSGAYVPHNYYFYT